MNLTFLNSSKILRLGAILAFFFLLFFVYRSSTVNWQEVHSLKKKINHIRTKSYSKLIRGLNKKDINYAEAFIKAKAYFNLKKYEQAAVWFARAFFKNRQPPRKKGASSVYNYLNFWGNFLKTKSPIATEALYYIALSYYNLQKYNDSLKFLDYLEDYLDKNIQERYLELKAKIYSSTNPDRSLSLYNKILEKWPKPTYYIRKGAIYQRQKFFSQALQEYF